MTREERNKALEELDMVWARKVFPEASSDYVLLLAMHKARYECADLPDSVRHISAAWLKEHNHSRHDGTAVLPLGILPL